MKSEAFSQQPKYLSINPSKVVAKLRKSPADPKTFKRSLYPTITHDYPPVTDQRKTPSKSEKKKRLALLRRPENLRRLTSVLLSLLGLRTIIFSEFLLGSQRNNYLTKPPPTNKKPLANHPRSSGLCGMHFTLSDLLLFFLLSLG